MASNGASTLQSLGEDGRLSKAREVSSQIPTAADGGFLALLSGNAFFTAGAGLAALGVVVSLGQKGIRQGAALLKRRLLVDVEISVNDESYPWFLYWMTIHQRGQSSDIAGLAGRNIGVGAPSGSRYGMLESILRRFTPGLHHLSIHTEKVNLPNGAAQTTFALIPGPGKHILRYRNAFLMVDRVRESKSMDLTRGRPWETVTLTTLYSHRHIFGDLFREAHVLAQQSTEGKIVVYHPDSARWSKFGEPRRKRPLESVILDKGIKERIVEDVKDFLGSSKWYYDRGIPYRRGYLLHGPPGSGKTSFIQALAGTLDYNIAMLNLSQRGLTDDRLNRLLEVVPERTLVLLEDADAAFGHRRVQTDSDGYQGANVTFSGLLNALDGVASAEERILFLTTNHVDRMDEALVRPGRVDMTVYLGDASRWQVSQFWERFYGDMDPEAVYKMRFLDRLEQLGMVESASSHATKVRYRTSTAALQGLFLYNKGNMEGALAAAEGLLPEGLAAGTGSRERKAVFIP